MKTRLQALSTVVVLGIAFTLSLPAFAGGKEGTLTGTVSDAMCGRQARGRSGVLHPRLHKEGSKYALVVGDKVYTLFRRRCRPG